MKRPSHCQNGHEFTPENTYPRTDGRRRCRMCRLAYNEAWRVRRRPWRPKTVAGRIANSIEVTESGCWEWTMSIDAQGYGRISIDGYSAYAVHRASYETFVGPIPDGLVIDHLCRNRCCCNPDHLETVTMQVNTLRGEGAGAKNARKTHCIRGHEFTEANTYRYGDGWRACRACRRRPALDRVEA